MKKTLENTAFALAMNIALFSREGNAKKGSAGAQSAGKPAVRSEPVKPVEPGLSNALALEGNDRMQYSQTTFKITVEQ